MVSLGSSNSILNKLCLLVIGFSLLQGLFGCSSMPGTSETSILAGTSETSILESYQSTESYGSLAVEGSRDIAGSEETKQFIRRIESYARERGINVIGANLHSDMDSKIVIRKADKHHLAVLYRGDKELDRLTLLASNQIAALNRFKSSQTDPLGYPLTETNARLVIDEMLLMWHPPDSNSAKRSPVPDYSLKPRFHNVTMAGIFGKQHSKRNLGNQKWFELNSLTPTITWEDFPREWDVLPPLKRKDFKNVRYQFQFYGWGSEPIVEADNLIEPMYQIEEKLKHCAPYKWTVRALFELNGVPRQTEWAGAYTLAAWAQDMPWHYRRNLARSWKVRASPGAYRFAVITPKNPFAEKCVL